MSGQNVVAYQNELNRLLALRATQLHTTIRPHSTITGLAIRYFYTLETSYNWLYMVPELAAYLRANAMPAVEAIFDPDTLEAGSAWQNPFWMILHNKECQGECGVQPYQQVYTTFQGLHLLMQTPYMGRYLDTPMGTGDLYYIDNLVSAIQSIPPQGVALRAGEQFVTADANGFIEFAVTNLVTDFAVKISLRFPPTPTPTPTVTETPILTETPTDTPTPGPSETPTPTVTDTPTPTETETPTPTDTLTPTPTDTETPTPTITFTPEPGFDLVCPDGILIVPLPGGGVGATCQ
jgi:hypothetical protein